MPNRRKQADQDRWLAGDLRSEGCLPCDLLLFLLVGQRQDDKTVGLCRPARRRCNVLDSRVAKLEIAHRPRLEIVPTGQHHFAIKKAAQCRADRLDRPDCSLGSFNRCLQIDARCRPEPVCPGAAALKQQS